MSRRLQTPSTPQIWCAAVSEIGFCIQRDTIDDNRMRCCHRDRLRGRQLRWDTHHPATL